MDLWTDWLNFRTWVSVAGMTDQKSGVSESSNPERAPRARRRAAEIAITPAPGTAATTGTPYNKALIATLILVIITSMSLGTVLLLLYAGGGAATVNARWEGISIALGGAFAAFFAIFCLFYRTLRGVVALLSIILGLFIIG